MGRKAKFDFKPIHVAWMGKELANTDRARYAIATEFASKFGSKTSAVSYMMDKLFPKDLRDRSISERKAHAKQQTANFRKEFRKKGLIQNAIMANPTMAIGELIKLLKKLGVEASYSLVAGTRFKMRQKGIDLPKLNELPKKPPKLNAEQKKLLKEAIPIAKRAVRFEANRLRMSREERQNFESYVLERLIFWVALHDKRGTKLSTHIIGNVKLVLNTFRRNEVRIQTGFTAAEATLVMGIIGKMRKGTETDQAIREAAEKTYNPSTFSYEQAKKLWTGYQLSKRKVPHDDKRKH